MSRAQIADTRYAAAHVSGGPDTVGRGHIGRLDRWLAAHLQRRLEAVAVRLELWDGSSSYAGAREPIGVLAVRDRRTLIGLIVNPDLWFGEAYTTDRLRIRGDLEPVLEALSNLSDRRPSWRERIAAHVAAPNTLRAARRNVHRHYDLGNEFYNLWLDDDLVYTCAYFSNPQASLDEAQRAKLDLVCRKLQLRPGDRVIEAGCGWGRIGPAHGRPLRRPRDRVQHLARTGRLRTRPRGA